MNLYALRASYYVELAEQSLLLNCIKKSPWAGRAVTFLTFPIICVSTIITGIAAMVEYLAYCILNLFGACFSKKYSLDKSFSYLYSCLQMPIDIFMHLLQETQYHAQGIFGKIEDQAKLRLKNKMMLFILRTDKFKVYMESNEPYGGLSSELDDNCRDLLYLFLHEESYSKEEIQIKVQAIICRFGAAWKNQEMIIRETMALPRYHYFILLAESIRNLPSFVSTFDKKNQFAELILTTLEDSVQEIECFFITRVQQQDNSPPDDIDTSKERDLVIPEVAP